MLAKKAILQKQFQEYHKYHKNVVSILHCNHYRRVSATLLQLSKTFTQKIPAPMTFNSYHFILSLPPCHRMLSVANCIFSKCPKPRKNSTTKTMLLSNIVNKFGCNCGTFAPARHVKKTSIPTSNKDSLRLRQGFQYKLREGW